MASVFNYVHRGEVERQVNAQVEYRTAAKSRVLVSTFGAPRTTRCVRASTAHYYNIRFHGNVHVHVTPGLPRWFTTTLGRRARGYLVTVTLLPKLAHSRPTRVYALNFAYQDRDDKHVVYDVVVVRTDVIPKSTALAVIHATA